MRTHRLSSNGRERRSSVLAKLGFLIVVAVAGWCALQYELSPVAPSDRRIVRVDLPKGAGTVHIADLLAASGVARNSYAMLAAIVLSGKKGMLRAGVYALTRAMSARQIVDILAEGKTDTLTVIVPEGFTVQQIAERLESDHLARSRDFIGTAISEGDGYSFPDGFAPPNDLEGYLFPLTYTIVRGSSDRQIVGQMVGAFDREVVRRYPDVRDWRTVIVMASMIEREAKVDSDRPLIASVYYNRLKKGMPLQCDATVQYALPEHKARLMYSDLKIVSPYNTYLHRGLPPSPICNPGLNSIEAALYPAQTSYLFYVAAPDGAHLFSESLSAQDRNISRLRKK